MYIICLATDYDGTLAHNGVVDPSTVEALIDFKRSGRKLVLVTGRELPDLSRCLSRLDLFDRVVAENGALLYNPATRKEQPLAPEPPEKPLTVVAALGPRMMALSAELADGAHPYNTTPEHTAQARAILGPGKLLCPEVWVLLENDRARARSVARQALSHYLQLDNYVRGWRRQGFGDDELAGGGSDRFLEAMVAWGDEGAIRARIQQHWDAGADHVCIQPIGPQGSRQLDERVLDLLAPARRS